MGGGGPDLVRDPHHQTAAQRRLSGCRRHHLRRGRRTLWSRRPRAASRPGRLERSGNHCQSHICTDHCDPSEGREEAGCLTVEPVRFTGASLMFSERSYWSRDLHSQVPRFMPEQKTSQHELSVARLRIRFVVGGSERLDLMQVHFERSGGFAGLRISHDVDSANLPPEEASELSKLIETAHFFELPAVLRATLPRADRV